MANGSFGLSGFPTAPTTTSGSGGGANNPAASVTATVQSATGFAAGELIYQRNNSFGTIPDNAFSTATFPATGAVPVLGGATADQAETSGVTNLGINGHNPGNQVAAKLTNGNIVIAWLARNTSTTPGWVTTSGCACFKIITENGETVVNTTCIDTVNTVNYFVAVTALSTGGFVVAFKNQSSNYIRYGIYTNTGTVTTAPQDDSTGPVPPSATWISIGARNDGNWVMTIPNASYGLQTKVYSNTGAQVYAWTSAYSSINVGVSKVMQIVRSDNTVVVFSLNGTSTLAQYAVLSATNTVTVANVTFTATAGNTINGYACDATLLSSGTVIFGAYNPSGVVYYRTLTSANVFLGTTPTLSQNVNPNGAALSLFGTSTGGLFVVSPSVNTSITASYAVYDSSLAVTVTPKTLPYFNYSSANIPTPSIIDTGTYIGVYSFPAYGSTFGYYGILSRFNKTTFLPVNYTESTLSSGVTSALPVSGYSRSGSTPSAATFLAATTTTVSSTSSQTTGSFVVGPTLISNSTTIYELDSMSFADGRFGFVSRNSSGVVTAYIYTVDGVLITSFTVTTSALTNSTLWWTKMVELGDGKLAITYPVSGEVLTVAVYSTAYALLNTSTFTPGAANNNYNVSLAAISGNRILVVYCNGSAEARFRVFSNTATELTSDTPVGQTSTQGWTRCAALGSGFVIAFQRQSSAQYYYSFFESATNVWTSNSNNGVGSAYGMWYNPKMNGHPGYVSEAMCRDSNGTNIGFVCAVSGGSFIGTSADFSLPNANQNLTTVAGCVTAQGSQVCIARNTASTVNLYAKVSPQSTSSVTPISLNISVALSTGANLGLAANKGNRVVFSYVSSTDNFAYFVILDALATNISTPIVSGVTSSSPVALSQPTGYTLLGVSTTAATAGGTGTVQINGPATLNANYSTTQSAAFDFQNPVTYGVKGVVNGLNVNLQGNV